MRYFLFLLFLLSTSCERKPDMPIGVPGAAILLITAPTLGELRAMSHYVEPLDIPVGDDETMPAWFACEVELCVLRRGGPADLIQQENRWTVPDGAGSLVVWGAKDLAALTIALGRWHAEPAAAPTATWSGFIEPSAVLAKWKPTKPRSKDLLQRVIFQMGRIDFTVKRSESSLDAELRMQPMPGEPTFVSDLGDAPVDPPPVAGLTDPGMLGMVRLSADPKQVWKLLRSLLSAERRGDLDGFVSTLNSEAALSVERDVLKTLAGHIYVVAYGLDPNSQRSMSDWISLDATHELIAIPVLDRQPLRRALDAWTQLSNGRLQVQTTGEQKQEWAWFDDDGIEWTAILGADYLLIVDSSVALDAARRWEVAPSPLAASLVARGVDELLRDRTRSGAYIDVAALRSILGDQLDGVIPGLQAITVSARKDAAGELVKVRMTLRAHGYSGSSTDSPARTSTNSERPL